MNNETATIALIIIFLFNLGFSGFVLVGFSIAFGFKGIAFLGAVFF